MIRKLLRRLGTLGIFLVALFFAVLALGGHLQLLEAREVMVKGQTSEGTITRVSSRGRKSTSYFLNYEFSVNGVTHAKESADISYGDFETLRREKKIQVWYDPADPAKNVTKPEMAELENWGNRIFLPLVSLALFAWWIVRLRRRTFPPAPPAAPDTPAKPEPVRFVNPIRRGD